MIRQHRIALRLSEAGSARRSVPWQAIFKFALHCVTDLINHRGMDLSQGRQRKAFRAELTKQKVSVPLHPDLRFALRESQIEAGGGTATHATAASTKSVD